MNETRIYTTERADLMPLSGGELRDLDENSGTRFPHLPGTDTEYIDQEVGTSESLAAEIMPRIHRSPTINDAISNYIPEDQFEAIMSVEPVSMEQFHAQVKDHVPNGNEGIQRHLKEMSKRSPKDAQIRVLGDKMLLTFQTGGLIPTDLAGIDLSGYDDDLRQIIEDKLNINKDPNNDYIPDRVTVLMDIGEQASSKKEGIKIEAILQERGEDGEVWDATRYAPPETDFRFKGHGLIAKILSPVRSIRGAASAVPKLTIGEHTTPARATFYYMEPKLAATLVHESNHLYDFEFDAENGDSVVKNSAPYGLTRIALPISAGGAGLATLFGSASPWILAVPFAASIGTYFMSRNRHNFLGKSFHELLISERRAYKMDQILKKLMQKNGYAIDPMYTNSQFDNLNIPDKQVTKALYEPLVWAAIDAMRERFERENAEPVPQPALLPA